MPARASPSDATPAGRRDRKSTRLNSSHQIISYAGYGLKKKNAKLYHSNLVERHGRHSRVNKPDMFHGTTLRAYARANVLAPSASWLLRRQITCAPREME